MKLRASSLPLYETCRASAYANVDEILIQEEAGPEAMVGVQVHSICQTIVEEELDTLPEIEYRGDSLDEVRMLSSLFLQKWREIRPHLINYRCEEPLSKTFGDLTISGHPDIVGENFNGTPVIIDIKTGRKKIPAYQAQLKSYAWLMLEDQEEVPNSQEIITALLWVREQEYEVHRFTRDELLSWVEQISTPWDGRTYSPGEFCQWCPRLSSCPGRLERLSGSLRIFNQETKLCLDKNGNLLPARDLFAAYEYSKELAKAITAFQKQLKEEIAYRGEIVSDSHRAFLQTRKSPSKSDLVKAWPILKEYLSDNMIAAITSLSRPKLTKAIAQQAEFGTKKKKITEVLDKLEQAGALTEGNPTQVLKIEPLLKS